MLNNIIFYIICQIKREEISNIYKVSDAVLFPSIYEGFGLPLLEAIKSGVPIVCSNLKVLKEIVKTKKFMAHPNNFKLFSKTLKISKFLMNNLCCVGQEKREL